MDLRDYIAMCEKEGQLKRVKAEVDWNLEISHIAKVVEEKAGPALLFENVKGYSSPVLDRRLRHDREARHDPRKEPRPLHGRAYQGMGESRGKRGDPRKGTERRPHLRKHYRRAESRHLCLSLPEFYELDGGRYFGTAVFMVIQDPETGDVNLGTYRMGILDDKTVGVQILKGKKADRIMKKYGKQGKKMPACAIIGGDPLHIFAERRHGGQGEKRIRRGRLLARRTCGDVKGQLTGFPSPRTRRSCWKGRSIRIT